MFQLQGRDKGWEAGQLVSLSAWSRWVRLSSPQLCHGFEQPANYVFLARCSLHHELHPIICLANPSRHLECPTVLLCCGTQSRASTVERCQGPTPSPTTLGFSTTQLFSTPSQHDWDITITHGPRHSSPKFVRNFLGQRQQAIFHHLFRDVCAVLFL